MGCRLNITDIDYHILQYLTIGILIFKKYFNQKIGVFDWIICNIKGVETPFWARQPGQK
jgi:hypothetical protein